MPATPPPIHELQASLAAVADPAKRDWWVSYLKGEAEFRGVPTPVIRKIAMSWWEQHEGEALPPSVQFEICVALLRCHMTEDKLAAMLLLGERLIPDGRVDCREAVPGFAELFDAGDLADWNAVDWFCVRVLGPLIEEGSDRCARMVAGWVEAPVLWGRRAAVVGFVTLAPKGMHAGLIIETADRLVLDQERFAQTGVAWVIRELSAARPDLTEPFLERHAVDMSAEAHRQARGRQR